MSNGNKNTKRPKDSEFTLPDNFQFGVATAGFQVEGGINGPGEPANNWLSWERAGRVEPSGSAVSFWKDYEDQLDRVAEMGCNSIRIGIEWARCEPEDGVFDQQAIDGYIKILQACRARGLEPLATLHHFTHPHYLGDKFWVDVSAPERYLVWVKKAIESFHPYCHQWVTINELNIYAIETFIIGTFPPGKYGDVASMIRTLDHLLTAHIGAYEVIHSLQPNAVVGTNNFCFSLYDIDRLLSDVLYGRSQGVAREDLFLWLEERRFTYMNHVSAMTPNPYRRRDAILAKFVRSNARIEKGLSRAIAAVYASPYELTLDVSQIDYYDPVTSHHLRIPGHKTSGGRNWLPGRLLWDHIQNPPGLVSYSSLNTLAGSQLWIVENGLGSRVKKGCSYPRLDGWDRPSHMKATLGAMIKAIEKGTPISGYWHWTLCDNYEWGSYEPRFGIFGIDRERSNKWLDTDSMGNNSAGAYKKIIEGLRNGDLSVVN